MKKTRILVFGSLVAVAVTSGVLAYRSILNNVTQPENVFDKYRTEAEKSAKFIGRYSPHQLTEKEISFFKSLSSSGDKIAAKKLAYYYWREGDPETARVYLKIAKVSEERFREMDIP